MANSKNSTTSKTLSPIVFFGSGPVAAASLNALAQYFTIEAVITKPAPAGHRGAIPVLEMAQERGWKHYTTLNKQELDAVMAGHHFTSTCGVVVDYGIIISQAAINSFPKGIVNSHFSLLPLLRGADPITFAILEGHTVTGVSLMLIVPALDEGPLLAQEQFMMPADITTPQLTKALTDLSNTMLTTTLPPYLAGAIAPSPQPATPQPTYSRRLNKSDGIIDWHKPAIQLEREIRAFTGWPQSRGEFTIASKTITAIITQAAVPAFPAPQLAPGQGHTDNNRLFVGTSTTPLEITKLKIPGKKEITAAECIRGYQL